MNKTILVASLAICSINARAEGYAATAKVADGVSLTVMDHGVSCNGKATAFVTDAKGVKRDTTCNVHIDKTGVTVRFASFPDPLRFKKEEFTVIPAP